MVDSRSSSGPEGFTLIELVVALVIIGLIASVALGRFVDVADDARATKVLSMSGAFKEAANLTHARWIAKGGSANVNAVVVEGGTSIGVNDAGWPENLLATGGDGVVTASECVELWSGLLTSPPTISTTAGTAAWLASAPNGTTCRFDDNGSSGRYFTYDSSVGTLAVVSTTASTAGSTTGTTSPSSTTPSSTTTTTSTGGSSTTCGLLGLEPFVVVGLVRFVRRAERRSPRV